MIQNANQGILNDVPSMPQLDLAVDYFISPMVIEIEQITNVQGFAQKIPISISTLGSIQPLSPKELKVKPEGQRSWSWYQLHVATRIILNTNDRVRIRGRIYKVMALLDYDRNGYKEYHVVLDFEQGDWM